MSSGVKDACKMAFGVLWLLVLAILAHEIAIGAVEEKTSFGLMPIVVALAGIGPMWAQWAFGNSKDKNGE